MARSESRISETDNRIRIAEAMGRNPGMYAPNYDTPIFNPYESDADCMALVRWLNERGYVIDINFRPSDAWLRLYRAGKTASGPIIYDDYKQGVVELALKVVGDE